MPLQRRPVANVRAGSVGSVQPKVTSDEGKKCHGSGGCNMMLRRSLPPQTLRSLNEQSCRHPMRIVATFLDEAEEEEPPPRPVSLAEVGVIRGAAGPTTGGSVTDDAEECQSVAGSHESVANSHGSSHTGSVKTNHTTHTARGGASRAQSVNLADIHNMPAGVCSGSGTSSPMASVMLNRSQRTLPPMAPLSRSTRAPSRGVASGIDRAYGFVPPASAQGRKAMEQTRKIMAALNRANYRGIQQVDRQVLSGDERVRRASSAGGSQPADAEAGGGASTGEDVANDSPREIPTSTFERAASNGVAAWAMDDDAE